LDIGASLKAIRKARGLSQRELAKRAGVTNSTISMIEKNGVSPSVSSLEKVLAGIPISLAEFFASGQASPIRPKAVYRADELPDSGAAGLVRKLIGEDIHYRIFSLTDQCYAPDCAPEPAPLRDGETAGIVIEGQLELSIELDTFILQPGDGYYLETERPHRFRNPFPTPCRVISVTTPAQE